MSVLLFTKDDENIPNMTSSTATTAKKNLIEDLIKYLEKQRQLIDVRHQSSTEHKWGMYNPKNLYRVDGADVYKDRATFPSFVFKPLKDATEKETDDFRKNNEELHKIAFWYD